MEERQRPELKIITQKSLTDRRGPKMIDNLALQEDIALTLILQEMNSSDSVTLFGQPLHQLFNTGRNLARISQNNQSLARMTGGARNSVTQAFTLVTGQRRSGFISQLCDLIHHILQRLDQNRTTIIVLNHMGARNIRAQNYLAPVRCENFLGIITVLKRPGRAHQLLKHTLWSYPHRIQSFFNLIRLEVVFDRLAGSQKRAAGAKRLMRTW